MYFYFDRIKDSDTKKNYTDFYIFVHFTLYIEDKNL